MVYRMVIYVDGACRGNGRPGAIAAAAACFLRHYSGNYETWTRKLPKRPTPTNQRAEITSVIIALEEARAKYHALDGSPWLDITIYTDSKYVLGCMTEWCQKWQNNGWINAAGHEVANRDLIEEALDLDEWFSDIGDVNYKWIPRHENEVADEAANDVLDE